MPDSEIERTLGAGKRLTELRMAEHGDPYAG